MEVMGEATSSEIQMQTSDTLRSSMQKGVRVQKEKSLFEAIGLAQRMWTDWGMDI